MNIFNDMKFLAPIPPSLRDLRENTLDLSFEKKDFVFMCSDTLIVIPARVASTRLPNKMLADIGGKPLIVRTWQSVMSAAKGIGEVVVACDGEEISEAIEKEGGKAILTDPNLPSGTDRVYAAYKKAYANRSDVCKFIINVQGDMPFVDPKIVTEAIDVIRNGKYDMSTIATKIEDDSYLREQVVKPVIAFEKDSNAGRALYFSRSAVPFNGPFYKHIGIYGFRADSLEKFVSLPQSTLEKTEKLEQLRALENGMTIGIKVLDIEFPISVDTAEDLQAAREHFQNCMCK